MTTVADRKIWTSAEEPPPARIRLTTSRSRREMLDGSWWPGSRDPVRELTSLVVALTAEGVGTVERVMLQPTAWDRHPRRIGIGDRVLRVGWFTTLDAGLVILTGQGDLRIDLAVVPPQTAFAVATAAMQAASRPGAGIRPPEQRHPGPPLSSRAGEGGNGHNQSRRDSATATRA
ncbi:DUF5994 family protein [Micromonospora sp. NBC_01796]|uniref:DUF5994 family protein n=1 Tax=Micromonospora sp. NBC_01796 TaxID=2975987 RepID=UPI002DD8899A|nr:DUF5994 family protein [Micromonospora sp. NBC_01796]WSA83545.1 DUF5994 family protein [Micromonospora sp. NBC_01796]